MEREAHSKVQGSHLGRDAYLYVRQSTLRQVVENTGSTERQYALRRRAVALGWPQERIHVIDCDLGQSGASAADREGFRKLAAEVSMGRVGIVLGIEVSRLARNCADWHRLLELCALSDTLILDEDGLYNPNHFNDRLLLGLKGTMSEAELHLLRARLRGGILNKARRGELPLPLPVGLVYDEEGQVRLDPDKRVRESLFLLFRTFRRVGSAFGTVRWYREQGLMFPRRLLKGPKKGQVVWGPLVHHRVLQVLHNPRYGGAFAFGRTRTIKRPDGSCASRHLPREEWEVLLPHTHEGYISWEEYEENQRRLRECAQAHGLDRRKSPPREGPALLQGLVLCGICGQRMTVRYETSGKRRCPVYACQRHGIEHAQPFCQRIHGAALDAAIGQLLLDKLTPMTLEVALAVQEELRARVEETDRLRAQQVEQVRYEADQAQQRFMRVDPNNRLVADVLEAEWNEKLRALQEAQEEYQRQRESDRVQLDDEQRARVMALATDFPRLWKDPRTADRDRKRMVRLLIQDVTLIQKGGLTAHVRFKGGATTTLTLPRPKSAWELVKTSPEVIAQIDLLLDDHTDQQIADILNERGLRPGKAERFNPIIVGRTRRKYGLKSRYDRLREAGMLTLKEMAQRLGVCTCTVKRWRALGLLPAHLYNDKNQYLFDPPGPDAPVKEHGRKLSERHPAHQFVSNPTNEV